MFVLTNYGFFLAYKVSGYTLYKITNLYKQLLLQFVSYHPETLKNYYIHVLKICLYVLSDDLHTETGPWF